MANKEMSEWMLFFRQAGVPAGPAAMYANTFVDNRIHKSMLLDLTKEYLKEMGIAVMGDVIAILKHAKTAHSKFERERPALDVLPKAADGKVELKRKTSETPKASCPEKLHRKTSGPGHKKLTALPYQAGGRMLEHYLRKEGIVDGTESPTKVKVSTEMAARLGAVPLAGSKKRVSAPGAVEVIPMKRIRKVDPAEEGAYIISMPKGSTPRTQKILQQKQSATPGGKSSVFARLGGGTPSPAAPTVTLKKTATTGQANVFNRLGGVSSQPIRMRSLSEGSTESTLEYQGVLKAGGPDKSTEPTVTITLGGPKAITTPKQSTVQDRLGGIQKPEVSTTTMTHMDAVTVKPSLHARLGVGKSQTRTSNLIQVRIGETSSAPAVKSPALQKRLGTHANMSNLIQVPIMDKPAVAARSPALQKRLGTQTVKLNSPSLQKRLGAQAKSPSTSLQARLGAQKKITTTPKQSHTASPAVKNMIITKPAHSIQERLGAQTSVISPPAIKANLAGRLGGKVNTNTSAGIFSASSPSSLTGMASDRLETGGVMKRLGIPVGGVGSSPTSPTKINLKRKRLQKTVTSPSPSASSVTSRTNIRERLGVQKAEASSTTPSLGLTVTTSGTGKKTVQAVGGASTNVGFGGGNSKKARRKRNKQAAAKSGVFSRLGTAN